MRPLSGSLSSLNDKIEEDDDLTWSQVKKNQEDTIAKTQEFADLYTQLINAGVSESYLNAIGATGPEALPLLKGMMNDGINAVLDSQAEWESAYDSINKTFTDGMKLSDEDKAILRDYISGESGVFGTLESAIQAAGFSEMVKETTDEAMQAIPGSIENALPDIRPLAVSMGKDTLSGYTEGMADTSGVAAAASYTQDELDRKEKLGKYIKGYR